MKREMDSHFRLTLQMLQTWTVFKDWILSQGWHSLTIFILMKSYNCFSLFFHSYGVISESVLSCHWQVALLFHVYTGCTFVFFPPNIYNCCALCCCHSPVGPAVVSTGWSVRTGQTGSCLAAVDDKHPCVVWSCFFVQAQSDTCRKCCS